VERRRRTKEKKKTQRTAEGRGVGGRGAAIKEKYMKKKHEV